MASEVKLPELGENLEGGEVLDIKVAAGDSVTEGQTLLEVEAEKSTVEVPAPVAGRVSRFLVKKGEKIRVGQTICVIEAADGQRDPETKAAEKPARQPTREASTREASTREPSVRQPSAREPSTREASQRRPSPASESKTPQSGRPAESPNPEEKERAPAAKAPEPPAGDGHPPRMVPAGPATRRLARELGVDLDHVTGTAAGGRVTTDDVKAHVRQLSAGGLAAPGSGAQEPPLPDFSRWGPVERKALDPVRRRTAEAVSLAWRLIPAVTQYDQADITELDAFRRQQEANGPKLTPTAFALKAAASALKQFPQFNASLDGSGGQLVLKHYYHIGVAVDTERGLLVPVLRDVDRKSVLELAGELGEIAERARQRKVTAEEMRGGTFTITNLGGIGGTGFSPIVNYPEVAILGLSRARLQPAVRDGQVVPRLILPLSVSYDHRVIDGADAARFTRRITEMLENPLQMLL